jgi:uncharacterized membrane protein
MKKLLQILFAVIMIQLTACYYDVQQDLHPSAFSATCDTTDYSFAKVSSILSAACYTCHSGSSASGGINLSTYTGIKTVVADGRLMGSIQQIAGFRPMPQNSGKLPDCEIFTIKNWIAHGSSSN